MLQTAREASRSLLDANLLALHSSHLLIAQHAARSCARPRYSDSSTAFCTYPSGQPFFVKCIRRLQDTMAGASKTHKHVSLKLDAKYTRADASDFGIPSISGNSRSISIANSRQLSLPPPFVSTGRAFHRISIGFPYRHANK